MSTVRAVMDVAGLYCALWNRKKIARSRSDWSHLAAAHARRHDLYQRCANRPDECGQLRAAISDHSQRLEVDAGGRPELVPHYCLWHLAEWCSETSARGSSTYDQQHPGP